MMAARKSWKRIFLTHTRSSRYRRQVDVNNDQSMTFPAGGGTSLWVCMNLLPVSLSTGMTGLVLNDKRLHVFSYNADDASR